MANTQISLQQAEAILEKRYKGKNCKYEYPGYKAVYGMVDQISIDTSKSEAVVVIQMNDNRYTCSTDSISECLTLLKK